MRFVGGNMKYKQARAVLFVMLAAISILPGCGKKKNNEGFIPPVAGAPAPIYPGQPGYPGVPGGTGSGCINVNGAVSALTFSVAGSNQFDPSGTGIGANLYHTNVGLAGAAYWRLNNVGDRIDVGVSGVSVTGIVTLQPATLAAIQSQFGGYLCGIQVSAATLNTPQNGPGWQGTLGGGLIRPIGWTQGTYYPGVPYTNYTGPFVMADLYL
jgi:hypothetical protein